MRRFPRAPPSIAVSVEIASLMLLSAAPSAVDGFGSTQEGPGREPGSFCSR